MNLSRDFCLAVYPYQSYSIWEKVFHRNETVLEYFQRLTLMDCLYYMQQSGKDFVLEMCNFLIDQMVQSGMSLNVDCTFEEYQQLMNVLAGKTDINKFIRLKQTEIDVLQDKKRQAEILKMLWYEMLMSLLRPADGQIDNKVGLMLEELMHNKLHQKGIATKTGRYVVDKIEGEADVVIETPDKILLVEMKKKTITRAARQGHIYQIVLDFAGSLLYSQEQCIRTDTLLRRKPVMGTFDFWQEFDWKMQMHEGVKKCSKK